MKTMYFNQYQIESSATERYNDNHKLIANTLGLLAEAGELADDVIKLLVECEKATGADLSPIKNQLMDAKVELVHCGILEKQIRKHKSLGKFALTPQQESHFQQMNLTPTPEQTEHIEGELGDVLFHLGRAAASIHCDLEHVAIKNRMKLTNRDKTNTICEHKDH